MVVWARVISIQMERRGKVWNVLWRESRQDLLMGRRWKTRKAGNQGWLLDVKVEQSGERACHLLQIGSLEGESGRITQVLHG